jgi:hypothetical protein
MEHKLTKLDTKMEAIKKLDEDVALGENTQ